jgi:hypothetical protein
MKANLSQMQGVETLEQRAKTFNRLVLQGKLRTAVRWVANGKGERRDPSPQGRG